MRLPFAGPATTTPDRDGPTTIPEALERAAASNGGSVAYVEQLGDGQRSVTWAELSASVRRTAVAFRKAGLNKGDRVAICAENSINWITAYLGAVLAGGAGVLVYYDQNPQEIRDQIAWPGCTWLVGSSTVFARLGSAPDGLRPLQTDRSSDDAYEYLEDFAAAGGDWAESKGEPTVPTADDLAAVIYTSGTTGGAKGVMLSHWNFVSNARAAEDVIHLRANDAALLVLPLHHAFPFLAAVVLVAIVGARVVIQNDLLRVRDSLSKHSPTIFFGVPALFEVVYRNVFARAETEGRLSTLLTAQKLSRALKKYTGLNAGPLLFRRIHKALGGRIRFLVSGGAALNPATALGYSSLGIPLLQGWGMTEAAPIVCVQRFSAWRFLLTRRFEDVSGSVGPPLPGVDLKLADVPDKGILVAESGEGEVLVRGPNVFLGYWNAPALTDEAKRDGWLHTGDVGRLDRHGNVYLTGRSKSVIVLESGEKVHPEELEARLTEGRLMEDVCVVGRKIRDKTQVAAVIHPLLEEVRAACNAARLELSEANVLRLVGEEVSAACRGMASYKKVSLIELSDQPLPRTALRKVARGAVRENYAFSLDRWLERQTAAAQDA